MANFKLVNQNTTQVLCAQDNKPTLLPRVKEANKSFLGWNKYKTLHYGYMNYTSNQDTTLYAIHTDAPAYILESYFRGDPEDYTGKRCHYRRYVIDVYLENANAKSGSFKLENCNNILYYVGNVSTDGVKATVIDTTNSRGDAYTDEGYITTSDITVNWTSEETIDAKSERKKLLSIMMYFSKWCMGYGEIARRTSDDIIIPDYRYNAVADGEKAYVSANFYKGIINEEKVETPDENVKVFTTEEEAQSALQGEVIARFAAFADSHIGPRYGWENYDWIYGVFDNIEKIHKENPLDFVLELGDIIDDGYDETYKNDYEIYLDVVKRLKICDPVNPIDGRADGTIPHYELQGNHDPCDKTRFFKEKLWFTENKNGKKVAFIAFFTNYGGYPAVNFDVAGNYESYRSYGILAEETVDKVEAYVKEAIAKGASQIILCNHFGIAPQLSAPVLPETGLGKIEQLCNKYNIRIYINGHEHNPYYLLQKYNNIYDYDSAMTSDRYAVFEVREKCFKATIYKADDNTVDRVDVIKL